MFNRILNQKTQPGHTKYLRDVGAVVLGVLFALFALGSHAQTTIAESSAATPDRIATSRGVASNELSVTGTVARVIATEASATKPRVDDQKSSVAKSGFFNDFEIFDADVTLYFDDDLDGHYYGIDVNFDADTDYASADVYAMLYLSLEGGPWELYYTTEVFTIFGDSGNDDYTVETELYSGYPTAYYDVLIELYDYDTGDFVAEFGPADSPQMDEAPLEDQQKDVGIITVGSEPIISQSRGGGGSTSLIVLSLLALTALGRLVSRRPAPSRLPATERR